MEAAGKLTSSKQQNTPEKQEPASLWMKALSALILIIGTAVIAEILMLVYC
ncbi:hypothetical protein ACIPR8_15345 [Stenotrophomonas sp. LARHCG68]